MAERTRGIQSIEVGGRILRALTRSSAPMALKNLTLAADLAPAQCHAYLTSYRSLGFVEQDQQTGHYRLGPFAMRLGLARIKSQPVLEQASAALVELSNSLGKVTMMVVWGHMGPTVLQFQSGTAAVTLNLRAGTIYSVTGTASGRVFASFDDNPAVREAIAAELSGQTTERFVGPAQNSESFWNAVARDRERGYSATCGVPIPHLNAVSAPIFDSQGKMHAAISIFGAEAELPIDADSPDVKALLAATTAISDT